MSLTCGFYNAISGDRKYNSMQMSTLFDGIINDGIFMSIGDHFSVSAADGMNVTVGTGRAWFNHTWTNNDADILLNIAQSEVILNRIDTVVLEVNSGDDVRDNTIKIIVGTPSMVPSAPSLISTDLIHQHPLCDIYVAAGVTSITQENITNKIGSAACPFITGILETINIDTLIAQWDAQWDAWVALTKIENSNWTSDQHDIFITWSTQQKSNFDAWFANIQDVLDENTAGNLLNLIETHTHVIADITDMPAAFPADGGNSDTVNGKSVLSDVPANAKFTDTVYQLPETLPASMITGLPTSLPANGGNAHTVDNLHFALATTVPTNLTDNLVCLVYE